MTNIHFITKLCSIYITADRLRYVIMEYYTSKLQQAVSLLAIEHHFSIQDTNIHDMLYISFITYIFHWNSQSPFTIAWLKKKQSSYK
uniref:Uncharacterized protein n=1 Tax=Wuchereria bancrofti TaxID=6293 RepID=A0AAF5PGQ8_WUCBA